MKYVPFVLMGLAALATALWMVLGGAAPTPQNLALFLALLIPAVTGLLAPFLALLHRRLPLGGRPPTMRAALRQAFLVGVAIAVAGWLQLNRLLDATLVIGLVACVVLVEWLAQSRAR
jgi:hypothetical protein